MGNPPQPAGVSGNGTTVAATQYPDPYASPATAASLIVAGIPRIPIPRPGLPLPSATSLAFLAYAFRRRQIALASHTARGIDALWRQHMDPSHAADSWRGLNDLIAGFVDQQFRASAADATNFYAQSRVMAGFGHRAVSPVELDQRYLERVLGSQSMGTFFHQVKSADTEVASEVANRALQGAGARLALKGGRDTIRQTSIDDPEAEGWERLISPGACGFCAMLAGRGGVYRKATVDFRAHDHCNCTAHPVFRGQETTNPRLQGEWARVTQGKSGAAARQAWNEWWDRQNEQLENRNTPAIAENRPGHAAIHL